MTAQEIERLKDFESLLNFTAAGIETHLNTDEADPARISGALTALQHSFSQIITEAQGRA